MVFQNGLGATRILMFLIAVLAVVCGGSLCAGEELLQPHESVLRSLHRGPEGDANPFLRLKTGETLSFRFCGSGSFYLYSRALMQSGDTAARYVFEVTVDGQRLTPWAKNRVTIDEEGGFDGAIAAGTKRTLIQRLRRGCHTVTVRLLRSTEPLIGVQAAFRERAPRKRRWQRIDMQGGTAVMVKTPSQSVPYRLLGPGAQASVQINGPGWIRFLNRTLDGRESTLEIAIDGEPVRSVAMNMRPSKTSTLQGDSTRNLSQANELTMAIPSGSHRMTARFSTPGNHLLRADWAPTASVPPRSPREWVLQARLASYYDDNILRYSDKFIERFEQGTDPDRFRVSQLDDVIHRIDIDLEKSFNHGRSRIGVDGHHWAYQENSIKDWSRFGFSLAHDFSDRIDGALRVTSATDFYVRHLRDSDLTGSGNSVDPFQAFQFEKSMVEAVVAADLHHSLHVTAKTALAQFDHSEAFREFDSDQLTLGGRVDLHVGARSRCSAALDWHQSDAQGYDQPGETLATSDDTDPSFRQVDLMVAYRFRMPGKRRHTFFVQAKRGERDYTTDKGPRLAPLHSGRDDTLMRWYGSWQARFNRHWSLTLFTQIRDRSSTASEKEDIGDEKDYNQTEYGLRITARFRTGR